MNKEKHVGMNTLPWDTLKSCQTLECFRFVVQVSVCEKNIVRFFVTEGNTYYHYLER